MRVWLLAGLLMSSVTLGQDLTLDAGVLRASVTVVPPVEYDPIEPTDKPSWMLPAHAGRLLTMPGTERKGHVDAVLLERWHRLLARAPDAKRSCVASPLKGLAKSLRTPTGKLTEKALLGCPDASPAFILFPTRVRFQGGEGWLFLTAWLIESVQVSNRILEWNFQGLTADGTTWVFASIPARADGLPESDGASLLGGMEATASYAGARRFLSKVGAAGVEPPLDEVRRFVESIAVEPVPQR